MLGSVFRMICFSYLRFTLRMILNSVLFLWYFSTLVFTIGFDSVKSDNALLFSREDNVLVQEPLMMTDEAKNMLKNISSACPASTPEEMVNNSEKSVGKNILFTNIANQSESTNDIELPECERLIQPSIVFNVDKGLLETGYEIHDKQNIATSLPSSSKHGRLLSLYPSDPKVKSNPKDVLSKYLELDEKIFPSEENTQSSIWLPVLSISFDIDTLSPIQIEYYPDSGSHWWRENCHRFDLGEEFYAENSVASFYSPENQEKLFNGIENHSTQSSKVQPVTSEEELECGQKYGCLVQHQIIPSYYLHSYYGSLATCTHMNTVPVWKSIVEKINLVDKYLYAMIQLWKPNIHVKNSFFDIFKPSAEYFEKIPFPGQALYLDNSNENISVPMILYKIVEYRIKFPPPQEFSDSYFAVIIIHNDPTPDSGGFRVCKGDWRVPGWEYIENEESKSGLIYVCGYNKSVAKKLQLFGGINVGDRSALRLDRFPIYNAEENRLMYHDVRSKIKQKIKELGKNKV